MSSVTERMALALPSYEIGDELGRGAWGVVVAGVHRELGRPVAIKELNLGAGNDPSTRSRFQSEARLLASFDHPHIVPIYDFVVRDDICLLVMEQLAGGTVWSRFKGPGFSMDSACSAVLAACLALDYAHRKGILHRDIKPDNLMFTTGHTLKVTDFGIAKVIGGSTGTATRVGEVLGTPAYMSPEQAMGKELTPATDVYSLGILLYEMLSGRLPFLDEANNPISLLYKHVHEPPPPLTVAAPLVPVALANVVMQALAKDVGSRFASAEAFGVAIAEATTANWGQGWVGRSGVTVVASGPIAERLTGRGVTATPTPTPNRSAYTPSATVIQSAVPLQRPDPPFQAQPSQGAPPMMSPAPSMPVAPLSNQPAYTPNPSYVPTPPSTPSPTTPHPAYLSGAYVPPQIQTGRVQVGAPVATGAVKDWPYNVAAPPPQPAKSKAWLVVLIVVILAILGGGVAIAAKNASKKTNDPPVSTNGDETGAGATSTTVEQTIAAPTTTLVVNTTDLGNLDPLGLGGFGQLRTLSPDLLKAALQSIGTQEPVGSVAGDYTCSTGGAAVCAPGKLTIGPEGSFRFGDQTGEVFIVNGAMFLIGSPLNGSVAGITPKSLIFVTFGDFQNITFTR